jgi:hypothetical protein
MIGGPITRSKELRLAQRLIVAAVTIVFFVAFLIAPSTSADACPRDKASSHAISAVHQSTVYNTDHKVFATAAPLMLKHGSVHTVVRCCGGVQQGGGCSTGHCSSCFAAIVVSASEEMLASVAITLCPPEKSALGGIDSPADFRPPRLGA